MKVVVERVQPEPGCSLQALKTPLSSIAAHLSAPLTRPASRCERAM